MDRTNGTSPCWPSNRTRKIKNVALISASSCQRCRRPKSAERKSNDFVSRLVVSLVAKISMLTVAGLSKSFGGRELFDDVSLNVMAGDRIAIVGPNGAGKSTPFKKILGQEGPDAGGVPVICGAGPR